MLKEWIELDNYECFPLRGSAGVGVVQAEQEEQRAATITMMMMMTMRRR